MRVITGLFRGRRLKEPPNLDIRPTSGMVKEALFSIIQFDIEGRKVLDLFAGTGQLGIEALSRGAASCVFIEKNKEAVKIIRENLETVSADAEVYETDALRFLESCGKYDLIFLDPPYDSQLLDKTLQKIYQFDICSEGGIIVCESVANLVFSEPIPPYFKVKDYRYGKTTKLTVIKREVLQHENGNLSGKF